MRRAGPLDGAFFGLEAPGHPLHGMAILVLDPATVPGGYSFARFRRSIAGRLPGIPPLRQRAVPVPMGLARPGWVDSEVDIRDHVFRHVRTGATLADVASYAAGIATIPLDRRKPLWEMHVVEGLDDGSVAIVAKVHHSLMDGIAGMEFLAGMFSLGPQADPVKEVHGAGRWTPGPTTALALAAPEMAGTPLRLARALAETGRAGWRVVRIARRQGPVAFPQPASMRWSGPLGSRRSIALSSLPLAEVKEVCRTSGTTVNDVVLSVVGGACRAYLLERDELPATSLTAVVPVSTHEVDGGRRDGKAAVDAANAVSLMIGTVGTEIADPLERLVAVHEGMVRAKRLHDALGGNWLTKWVGVVNPLVMGAASRLYLALNIPRRAPIVPNVLVSDVPGPPVPLYFCGARLMGLFPLGPVYDGVGLNVTAVGFAGSLGIGLVSSPNVVDDLPALAAGLRVEFDALRAVLSVSSAAAPGKGSARDGGAPANGTGPTSRSSQWSGPASIR